MRSATLRPKLLPCLLAASVITTSLGPTAQAPNPPLRVGTGLMTGQVLEGDSETPVEGARVTRWLIGADDLRQYETIADEKGRFLFKDVAPGHWRVVSEFPGFTSGAYGRRRPSGPDRLVTVHEGAITADVVLRMFRSDATISGMVTDERGEPAVNVTVVALSRPPGQSSGALVPQNTTARTDDRGRYRLRVSEGHWAVVVPAATVSSSAAQTSPSQPTVATVAGGGGPPALTIDRHLVVIGRATHPALLPALTGTSLNRVYDWGIAPGGGVQDAALIHISNGQHFSGVDVQLRLVPAVTVSGRVVTPDGPGGHLLLRLVRPGIRTAARGPLDVGVTTSDRDGAFKLYGVPPGDYVLFAEKAPAAPLTTPGAELDAAGGPRIGGSARDEAPASPAATYLDGTLWAEARMSVGSTDLDDVELYVRPGGRVTGRIVFEGPPPPPADVMRRSVMLYGADGRGVVPPAGSTRVSADGQFVTGTYPPGQYIVHATSPAGWVMKSAVLRGRDVVRELFDLGSGDLTGLVVTFTNKVASVSGSVRTASGAADSQAAVVLFPVDYTSEASQRYPASRFRNVPAGADGRFSVGPLPAQEYFIAAVDDRLTISWRDTTLLDTLARRATRVTLREGEPAVLTLRTVILR